MRWPHGTTGRAGPLLASPTAATAAAGTRCVHSRHDLHDPVPPASPSPNPDDLHDPVPPASVCACMECVAACVLLCTSPLISISNHNFLLSSVVVPSRPLNRSHPTPRAGAVGVHLAVGGHLAVGAHLVVTLVCERWQPPAMTMLRAPRWATSTATASRHPTSTATASRYGHAVTAMHGHAATAMHGHAVTAMPTATEKTTTIRCLHVHVLRMYMYV